ITSDSAINRAGRSGAAPVADVTITYARVTLCNCPPPPSALSRGARPRAKTARNSQEQDKNAITRSPTMTPPDSIIPSLLPYSKSSIFEKLSPDLRAQVDQALINRDPASYKDVYARFRLGDFGVSTTSFNVYGRQIREPAA